MVPYHGWMDEPKIVLTDVDWHTSTLLQRVKGFLRYGKWLTRTTRWYSLDTYDISEYDNLIQALKKSGMNFQTHYSPDVDYVYVMFLAGNDGDLTALRILK